MLGEHLSEAWRGLPGAFLWPQRSPCVTVKLSSSLKAVSPTPPDSLAQAGGRGVPTPQATTLRAGLPPHSPPPGN